MRDSIVEMWRPLQLTAVNTKNAAISSMRHLVADVLRVSITVPVHVEQVDLRTDVIT